MPCWCFKRSPQVCQLYGRDSVSVHAEVTDDSGFRFFNFLTKFNLKVQLRYSTCISLSRFSRRFQKSFPTFVSRLCGNWLFARAVSPLFNPFIPRSDQDIISPSTFNIISSTPVMRIQKNIKGGDYFLIQCQILRAIRRIPNWNSGIGRAKAYFCNHERKIHRKL